MLASQSPLARVPAMLPQNPGTPPALMHIGDETPLGRFAQPILPPPAAPMVQRAPTGVESQRDKAQGDLEHLQWEDKNPYGSADNHPGTGGKILHGLASFGNVAGQVLMPNLERAIPGSALNRQDREGKDLKDLETLSTDASQNNDRDATTGKTLAETAAMPVEQGDKHRLADATVANLDSEVRTREHPQPKSEFELWRAQNPNGTAQDFEQIQKAPLSQQDADARNGVWDTIADKYHLPKGQFRAGMSGADAAALAGAMNQVVGRDQGGTKIVIQQQGADTAAKKANDAGVRTRDAETEKEYNAASKDLNKQFNTAQTQSEALDTARKELASGAVGQAVGTVKTMVGLAGGAGSGVRITQAELDSIANARGLGGSFEGYINRLSGQGKLSPAQLQEMDGLLQTVANTVHTKMGKQDQYLDRLAQAGSPQEIRQTQSEYRKELLGGKGAGGTIRARDLQGKLHEAPAGTALPAGWTKE